MARGMVGAGLPRPLPQPRQMGVDPGENLPGMESGTGSPGGLKGVLCPSPQPHSHSPSSELDSYWQRASWDKTGDQGDSQEGRRWMGVGIVLGLRATHWPEDFVSTVQGQPHPNPSSKQSGGHIWTVRWYQKRPSRCLPQANRFWIPSQKVGEIWGAPRPQGGTLRLLPCGGREAEGAEEPPASIR